MWIVHDYGDLCQAVTELAQEKHEPISVDEFHTFNRCLDSAIAGAVTEYGRERDQVMLEENARTLNERLGVLAHELRNLLNTATLAYDAIKGGHGAVAGATGAVLDRSFDGLRALIDRTLAEVRLTAGLQARRESIMLDEFLEEVRLSALLDASARNVSFTVSAEPGLSIETDRQMLSSALANLLQNAFKFSRRGGHVSLTARAVAGRVLIDVADQCGGLPPGLAEQLFQPFTQRGAGSLRSRPGALDQPPCYRGKRRNADGPGHARHRLRLHDRPGAKLIAPGPGPVDATVARSWR